ncbi:peptidoglycan-binding protein [Acrocarpospora phusangensis]|uniref:Peptidoglycan-binding protein n=1 Tax=Acrocarpospora phusangensis TaxID=1070424 RepID=A0A919QMT5_9ACTN|nr:peptidoglycan-binding protein [Acrocarpospora phusangensis]GIH29022.1 peptidoglycan-binding protein [Acrocarpospora phusangensis]
MRRGGLLAGAVAVLALAGGGVAAFSLSGEAGTPSESPSAPPVATAEITRSDLVDSKTVDGTLGYAGRRVLPNQARGTVTRTRAEGSLVRRGGWLYSVDGRPVSLMYGSIPMYRTLAQGSEGKDVEQLERNLETLGYETGTVDEYFSWVTARAVRDWQEDRNLAETGTVDAAQVIVVSGAVRIAEVTAEKGDQAGQSVVTTTSTKRVVHIDLAASDQQLARLGAKVTLETPAGGTASGTITAIGTVAEPPAQDGGESTIDVEVTAEGRLGRLDQAPVTVDLQSERRENVLSVPVEALLALREGGYGVQVAGQGVVAVETGLFASGQVEITGEGLTEGMRVEVPAT